jgi:signal transduction histidine kinase
VRRAMESPVRVMLGEIPWLVFAKHLNPGSMFPAAFEVCVYPLSNLLARQRQLQWQVLGAGALLLLVGLAASHVASGRLSKPVERLVVDSERSARFSADASHQLKTPVTVMRAGLEELLADENLTSEECHQISALIHQTYRLSSLIEDLLLLSRLDAGRLKLDFRAVNLSELIEAAIDDLSALPDELEVDVETDFPSGLHIAGEKRYTTIILQNLLENARKYNRRGGRIRIAAATEGEFVRLIVGNTGRPISAATQEHIFERFHRGAIGENVPGYGLGLNLARELARLHQGDLRLVRSDENWTEFEVRFQLARTLAAPA